MEYFEDFTIILVNTIRISTCKEKPDVSKHEEIHKIQHQVGKVIEESQNVTYPMNIDIPSFDRQEKDKIIFRFSARLKIEAI